MNNESKNLQKLKKTKIIDFTIDNMPYKVEILSRAAKAIGKFKYLILNIKNQYPCVINRAM